MLSKRLLEAARFMWYDGIELMLQNEWEAAIEIFRQASAKKEGWGWAVNYGDIWLSEAVALMMNGMNIDSDSSNTDWIQRASELVEKADLRVTQSGVFDEEGHPWTNELKTALKSTRIYFLTAEILSFGPRN